MEFFGEMIALATALCWAFTTLFFTEAGKRIGAFHVNKIRLLLAAIIYTIILYVSKGYIFPETLLLEHVIWLGLSGIIGFVIGDGSGFKAMVIIGPRLTMINYASAPVIATLIAWGFLDESLSILDIIGILLTLGGIVWVILERQNRSNRVHKDHPDSASFAVGVGYSFIFAFGQGAGLVLSKHAMLDLAEPIAPMEASFIRILVALGFIWIVSALRGKLMTTLRSFKDKKAVGLMIGGAICGPFLGVWSSLVAVQYIAAGVSATLNSTVPIWILPMSRILYKEKITARVLLGTLVTIGGIALLMLQ